MAVLNSTLGSSQTTLCTVEATKQYLIQSILFCNISSTDVAISIHVFPSGNTAGNNNIVIKDILLSAGDTFVWESSAKLILDVGDTISAVCSIANAVVATTSFYKGSI